MEFMPEDVEPAAIDVPPLLSSASPSWLVLFTT
jgi:hypothetical protein